VRIAAGDPQLERRALRLLDDAATSAIPSLRARARKLSKEFAERRGGR
jgi:hypothetical protein